MEAAILVQIDASRFTMYKWYVIIAFSGCMFGTCGLAYIYNI